MNILVHRNETTPILKYQEYARTGKPRSESMILYSWAINRKLRRMFFTFTFLSLVAWLTFFVFWISTISGKSGGCLYPKLLPRSNSFVHFYGRGSVTATGTISLRGRIQIWQTFSKFQRGNSKQYACNAIYLTQVSADYFVYIKCSNT